MLPAHGCCLVPLLLGRKTSFQGVEHGEVEKEAYFMALIDEQGLVILRRQCPGRQKKDLTSTIKCEEDCVLQDSMYELG